MLKSEAARKLRERFPNMATLALARVLYNKNKILFTSVENARDALRYIEGKGGTLKRGKIKDKFFMKEARPLNPYKLPESNENERLPYILPTPSNNILLISDLHFPYHNIGAINAALDYGVKNKINTIIINGDLMDFYQLSKFEKDPRKRGVKYEFDCAKEFLRILRKKFKHAGIYWIEGNHDKRYERWLMTKCVEIFDDDYYKLSERLRLNEENIHLISDSTFVKAGRLSITHGHHIMKGFFSPVNSARGVYLKAKQSTIIGHVHKVSSHSETDMDGKVITTWSTGCLCELKPDYSPMVSNYQHGFAHIVVDKNGDYSVKNYQIINGKLH